MLNQIISHTPAYVWAILAFLVLRGVIAMRTREIAIRKLFIIPVVMLVLSLQDIGAKFGYGDVALTMWALALAATVASMWRWSATRVAPAATPGRVIVRGSMFPLALMMGIFVTKYMASIIVAVQPHLRQDLLFTVVVCALFGVFNGYFLGRLAGDLKAYLGFAGPLVTSPQTI
ncbi:MAG TPA: DUF6622 family protein [Telluria sp.]|jgi:hypothetical protein